MEVTLENKSELEWILAIHQIDDEATLRRLMTFLKDPEESLRMSAAEALGKSPQNWRQNVCLELIELLDDRSELVRCASIDALASLRCETVEAKLLHILKFDESSLVRATAAEAIGDLGTNSAIATLCEILKNETDSSVLAFAVIAVGLLGNLQQADEIGGLLKRQPEAEVKVECLGALVRLQVPEAFGQMIAGLDGADDEVFINFANMLTDLLTRRPPFLTSFEKDKLQQHLEAVAGRNYDLAQEIKPILVLLKD